MSDVTLAGVGLALFGIALVILMVEELIKRKGGR